MSKTFEPQRRTKGMRARIISLEGNRLYVQDHSIKPSYKFDVTDVYYFCKEMFTTDWQKAHEALSSESIDNQEQPMC